MPRAGVRASEFSALPPAKGDGDGGSGVVRFEIPDFNVRRSMQISFTCNRCETRQTKQINREAYHRGLVIITCEGCAVNHLISDHLDWVGFSSYGVGLRGGILWREDSIAARADAAGTLTLPPSSVHPCVPCPQVEPGFGSLEDWAGREANLKVQKFTDPDGVAATWISEISDEADEPRAGRSDA